MNIYFRTNYNAKVGIGNFMRVVMLAEKLKKKHTCIIILDKKMNEFKNLNLKFDHLYNNDLEFKSQETDAKKFILKVNNYFSSYEIYFERRIGSSMDYQKQI